MTVAPYDPYAPHNPSERSLGDDVSSIISRLENWHSEKKGRYVRISIDTTFGATCWEVVLGDVTKEPQGGWYVEPIEGRTRDTAEVHAAEVAFLTGETAPNVVFAQKEGESGWPGLERTIQVAIEKAEELGL